MDDDVARIRSFLIRRPRAKKLRITDDSGVREMEPWGEQARVAESIAALRPDLLEALDGNGNMIRAIRLEGASASEPVRTSDASPEAPAGLETDPTAAMLTHFANLLHRAYEHSTSVAFARMVEIVQLQNERSTSIEARLERTESERRQQAHEKHELELEHLAEVLKHAQEDGNGNPSDILGMMLQGFMQAKAGGPPPAGARPPTNGKAKH